MNLLLQNPRQRELLFHQLEQLASSAVPMAKAAAMLSERRSSLERKMGRTMLAEFQRHASIPVAMRGEVEPMEFAVISAADESGHLSDGFRHLGNYYGMLSRTRQRLLFALIYPLIVLHLAMLVIALLSSRTASGSFSSAATTGVLKLWAVLGLSLGLTWMVGKLAERSLLVDRLVQAIPLVGKVRKHLAWSRWCLATHFQVLAGRNFGIAIAAGGAASRSAVVDAFSQRVAAATARGQELGPQFTTANEPPQDFSSAIETGEAAGKVDEVLGHWCMNFQTAASRALESMAVWLPKLVLAAAAILVAKIVISFYADYFGQISDMAKFLDS